MLSLEHHYQNAYVTRDIDRATAFFKSRYGYDRFVTMGVKQHLKTTSGSGEAVVKLAMGWNERSLDSP